LKNQKKTKFLLFCGDETSCLAQEAAPCAISDELKHRTTQTDKQFCTTTDPHLISSFCTNNFNKRNQTPTFDIGTGKSF